MKKYLNALVCTTLCAVSLSAFELSSPNITKVLTKSQEYQGFGCNGKNTSPLLTWSDAPDSTKSFALTVYDPDAPTGSGWWHWIVYNIPKTVSKLEEDSGNTTADKLVENAVFGRNDYGTYGFGGACPPQGDTPHRYQFTLFALDVEKLELSKDASAALIGYMLNSHTIEKATLEFTYAR